MRIYELCFVKEMNGNLGRNYQFQVTQVTEITDLTLPGLVLDSKEHNILPFLNFKNQILKGIKIGDYLTGETENDTSFNKFQRCLNPSNPIPEEQIMKYLVEHRARLEEKKNLSRFRKNHNYPDRLISKLQGYTWSLSRSEKAAFALYVYQSLYK